MIERVRGTVRVNVLAVVIVRENVKSTTDMHAGSNRNIVSKINSNGKRASIRKGNIDNKSKTHTNSKNNRQRNRKRNSNRESNRKTKT